MINPLSIRTKKLLLAATLLIAGTGAPAHLSAQVSGTPAPAIQADSTPCPAECDQTVCAAIKANEQSRRQRTVNANHAPTPPNNLDSLSCLDILQSLTMSVTPTLPAFQQVLSAIASKACQTAMSEWQSVANQTISAAESAITSASPGAASILGTVNSQLSSVAAQTIGVQIGTGSSGPGNAGSALGSSSAGSAPSGAGKASIAPGSNASNAANSIFGGGGNK